MMINHPVSYGERVEQALARWESRRSRAALVALTHLLDAPSEAGADEALEPRTADDALFIENTWLTIIDMHERQDGLGLTVERLIVLHMFASNQWRHTLKSENHAYQFLSMLTDYLWLGGNEGGTVVPVIGEEHVRLGEKVHRALVDWLPADSTPETLTQRCIAEVFFGVAWCDLVYESRPAHTSLACLIRETRPPFIPGRLTASVETLALLPDLDAYTG
jgi:hypothetical protein